MRVVVNVWLSGVLLGACEVYNYTGGDKHVACQLADGSDVACRAWECFDGETEIASYVDAITCSNALLGIGGDEVSGPSGCDELDDTIYFGQEFLDGMCQRAFYYSRCDVSGAADFVREACDDIADAMQGEIIGWDGTGSCPHC